MAESLLGSWMDDEDEDHGVHGGGGSSVATHKESMPKGVDPALARLLESMDLGRFLPQFVEEEMDIEAFGEHAQTTCTHHPTGVQTDHRLSGAMGLPAC
jgi:hypothetical protein